MAEATHRAQERRPIILVYFLRLLEEYVVDKVRKAHALAPPVPNTKQRENNLSLVKIFSLL